VRVTPSRAARLPRRRLPAATGRSRAARRTVLALVALAAVTTAHAPSVITVKPGDTLWDLARAHGTTVSELQRLNGLDASGTVYAGRTLTLPGGSGGSGGGSAGGSGGSGGVTHRVVAGDTLSHLAVRYGVSARAIAQANGLPSSGLIRLGATLTVPGGGSASLAPQTTNAGLTIPDRVRASVASHRAVLAARSHHSKAQVREIVAATARKHGVDPALAQAVAFHESGFQQRVVSPVDAIGVMQVLPSTGRGISQSLGRELDLLDVHDNVTAGVVLLKQLVRSTGSTDAALAGYYQGLRSVAQRGRLPQTEAYIKNVNALRARFGG
jgi:LysM repeat protein